MTAGGKRFRVLVVEDNRDTALLLVRLLQLHGYEVEAVHTGPEALPAAERFGPDCILCDIGLPGLSGYEVAHQIRAHESLSQTLLVALTAYSDTECSKQAGFDHHLLKPGRVPDVLRVLSELNGE